ncbi:uncharacterized protein LOC127286793 [Leptopilina boulardi]|uniref:uncharacterized protein LOC127286793 n=1 Tax=Leptopilina boulardi TaxID=63433 RepID=UPI0021F68A23|nr:uncharacterized protein LOC127286793 [Leptopilina boulardi]XP_051169334.1 uncharacterized protein LOC127286793 [Leptopilina boulardi]
MNIIPPNPLQTVQLIPVYSYLCLLSDFLIDENYLPEMNHTKQIPVINALYKYLDDNRNRQFMKIKLIRNILMRSDLYGGERSEKIDITFVNAMFDYIISSLVFDKYGNIYGFLTEVFRMAENLEIDYILNITRKHLQNASFENEYGDRSILSSLAVNRIYNDIILPLFPRPKTNINLSSFDYIYAQAGLMFLQLGKQNPVYYCDLGECNSISLNYDKLFDEFVITGHLIEKLFLSQNKNLQLLKVFALPALSYYMFNTKYLYAYENIANIISDSNFWRQAYRDLFQYTFDAFNNTNDPLSIRSKFLETICGETVHNYLKFGGEYMFLGNINNFEALREEYRLSLSKVLSRNRIFKDISLHIEDPAFEFNFITKDDINLLENITYVLISKINLNLTFIKSALYIMKILKSNTIRIVGAFDGHTRKLIYVHTVNNQTITGYGYKFMSLSENLTENVYLRTDYELENESLVLLIDDILECEERYIILNTETLKHEPNSFMYNYNNQIRNKNTKVSFSGISIYHDDDNCNNDTYFQYSKDQHVCLRQWNLMTKLGFMENIVKFVQDNTNLSEGEIHTTLSKYTFPDNTSLEWFAENWMENKKLKEPSWYKNYIIDNPQHFNILRYSSRLEKHRIFDTDGIFRIHSIYSYRERRRIEKETSIKNIIKDYNDQKAYFSATFEDYYAVRNYATTGYKRITADTNEAKLMKLALYNLAIRQSDDPIQEYESKLFIVESKRNSDGKNNILLKKTITLQKFTIASTDLETAMRFAVYPADGFINVIYEMKFSGPYIKVKIDQFYNSNEKKIILLPGSEFTVTSNNRIKYIEKLGTVYVLKLEFKHDIMEKYSMYKKIMNEMEQIQF